MVKHLKLINNCVLKAIVFQRIISTIPHSFSIQSQLSVRSYYRSYHHKSRDHLNALYTCRQKRPEKRLLQEVKYLVFLRQIKKRKSRGTACCSIVLRQNTCGICNCEVWPAIIGFKIFMISCESSDFKQTILLLECANKLLIKL